MTRAERDRARAKREKAKAEARRASGTVSRSRSRQTGTVVEVVDNRDGFFDSCDPNGWFTVCVDHGGVCSHETRALAMRFAPVPREWCPTCQEEAR